jgi:hypothetical protein
MPHRRRDAVRRYAFGPAVRLAVDGSPRACAHFEREYGPSRPSHDPPDVAAEVVLGRMRGATGRSGGHKTARWRVAIGPPDARPLRVSVALGGGPPSFALSLVQGYHVEPLLAIALARAGYVALPGAAIVTDAGAVVLMGRSGSGKSSVSVRALAGGRRILGDDQVVVGADGGCWPYPRRLRLYPDVEQTAPVAWRRLRRSTRGNLRMRRLARRATRGFVAPSLAVPVSELGAPAPDARAPVKRLVVVERAAGVAALDARVRDAAWALRQAAAVIAEQRARFATAAGEPWRAALAEAARSEGEVLRAWLGGVEVGELRIPAAWDAATAVAALADRLEG